MEPETRERSRPFTLLDGLVFVAVTAAGLASTRGLAAVQAINAMDTVSLLTTPDISSGRSAVNGGYHIHPNGPGVSALTVFWAQRLSLWASPCLLLWTAASCVMGFVASRPPSGRPFARPGQLTGVACIVAFVALGATFPFTLIGRSASGSGLTAYWLHWWAVTCFALPRSAALAVFICWLTLVLSGNWRPDRGWLDRLGRMLGAFWILLGLASVASSWLPLFTG